MYLFSYPPVLYFFCFSRCLYLLRRLARAFSLIFISYATYLCCLVNVIAIIFFSSGIGPHGVFSLSLG
ncbi:hypothetical protein DFP73DRAFT_545600 [Morchella snyderi]|nr:hypothetical protein DFP73DRAFT_545600 [Morchella snyderi]